MEEKSEVAKLRSLAQLDAEADTSATPSILNLFSERAAGADMTTRMTDWDLAYLDGLYAAPRHANNVQTQQRAITRRMERELSGGAPAEPQN